MKKINKEEVRQEVFDLYDRYAHNKIDRRSFVEQLSLYAVGGLTVPALLDFLMPKYQSKQQIRQNDPRVQSEYIEYDSPKGGGTIKGLLAQPKGNEEKLPGVIVVHENEFTRHRLRIKPHGGSLGRDKQMRMRLKREIWLCVVDTLAQI